MLHHEKRVLHWTEPLILRCTMLFTLSGFLGLELGAIGAVLLNVIEGGKKRKVLAAPRRVSVASLLQALPEAVLLLDQSGRIVSLNPSAERLTGRTRAELLGKDGLRLLQDCLHAVDADLIKRSLRGEAVRTGQITMRTRDDSQRVIVSAGPLYDHSGSISGVVLSMQDVTELSALQTHSDSTERHVAVGQMTAGIVHDFNNVLNTIAEGLTILQLDCERSEHDRGILNIIDNAIHHGAEIIRNTREYLVGTREKHDRVDVRQLLDEVLELTHPLLKTHSRVQVLRQTQDCGHVVASPNELRRAFTNLILNALDAMPQGGTLTVSCNNQADHRIVVAVRDTGVGIAPEMQKKIFSPYFTTKAKGTGLGLAGARRAIHDQGGEIHFASAPGSGTTFFVTFPIAQDRVDQAPSAA